jgi:hypothetical protein
MQRNNLTGPKSDNMQRKTCTITLLSIIVTGFVVSYSLTQIYTGDNPVNAATGKPSKVFLKIEDFKINKGPGSSIDVTGKVVNNSSKTVQDIKLTASYYDDTNTLLTKSVKFLSNPSENVKPNGIKNFNFVETATFTRIAHSTANATANEVK